ncbi:putative membrane protein [Clostridioides difficile CD69]|nr:putative membrane protein [Clostridioides difficile CD69]
MCAYLNSTHLFFFWFFESFCLFLILLKHIFKSFLLFYSSCTD